MIKNAKLRQPFSTANEHTMTFSHYDVLLALGLFTTLVLSYLLTFSGEFSSIDELMIYAVTESLVQIRQPAAPQLAFAVYHNPVGVIEPFQSLMAAPLYLLAQQFRWINNIHAVLLLNVLITALTGSAMFILLRLMRYRATQACLAALGYGLTTTAWPYTRTLFREPSVGLMWTVATLCLIACWQSGHKGWLFGTFVALGLGVATKISAVIAVPIFSIAIASRVLSGSKVRAWLIISGISALALALGSLGFVWRYGSLPSIADYTIYYPFIDGLVRSYGQLLSPAKGLLFHSPVLLVSLPGWIELWRRQRAIVLLTISMALGNLYVYGNNPNWYGGLVWGPRFMVPLLPLLLIPLAGALSSRYRTIRVLTIAGAVFSLLLQLAVVTADWGASVGQMDLSSDPHVPWYDLRLWMRSPALFQLTHWQPAGLNLLWWHRMSDGTTLTDLGLAGAITLLLAIALAMLVWLLKTRHLDRNLMAILVAGAITLVLVGCCLLLIRGYYDTRDYPGLAIDEAHGIAAQVSSASTTPFTLVSVSNEFHIYYWLGLIKGHFVHFWYSPAATEGFEPTLQSPLPAQVLWLYVDRVHLQPDQSGYDAEYWLNRHANQVNGMWFGGHKVLEYALPNRPLSHQPIHSIWTNGIALVSFGWPAQQIKRGQTMCLEFEFERIGPVAEDYHWFTHLVRADGQVILGRDGEPQYGGAPTSLWKQGERILDRRAIVIPPDALPGQYTLYAGFISPTTSDRVPTGDSESQGASDHIELGAVEVIP